MVVWGTIIEVIWGKAERDGLLQVPHWCFHWETAKRKGLPAEGSDRRGWPTKGWMKCRVKCRRVEPPGRRLFWKTGKGYLQRVLTGGVNNRQKDRVKCRTVEPPGRRLSREVHCHKSHIGEVSSQQRPYTSLAPQPQQLAFGVWFSQGLVLFTKWLWKCN